MPTPLKRQIGYKRPEPKVATMESPNASANHKKAQEFHPIEPPTGKEVAAWIHAHPLFKWSAMCKDLKIDKSNFSRDINSKDPALKNGVLAKVVSVITKYGFRK